MIRYDDDTPHLPDEGPLTGPLAEAARDYHRPPMAPREDIWKAIEARRRTEAAAPAPDATSVAPTSGPALAPRVIPLDVERGRRHRARTWSLVAAGLAAGLVLGIVGERMRDRGGERVAAGPAPVVESGPVVAARDSGAGGDRGNEGVGGVDTAASLRPARPVPAPVTSGAGRVFATRGMPEGRGVRREEGIPSTPSIPSSPSPLYRAAAVQTLSQAEALLVAYRAETPDAASARQLGAWARDVLSSTRLLLDSPAARDPQLRRLLDDLELVLAQLVQLSGAPLTAEERTMVEDVLRTRDLLPRIRSAVPAGAATT